EPLTTQIAAFGVVACAYKLAAFLVTSTTGEIVTVFVTIALVLVAFLAYPVATVIALYRTYREGGVEEKRQVTWPLWATAVVLVLRIVCGGVGAYLRIHSMFAAHAPGSTLPMRLVETVALVIYVLIPLAFAFAIVKYRLMNIDLIIRRTVTYAL